MQIAHWHDNRIILSMHCTLYYKHNCTCHYIDLQTNIITCSQACPNISRSEYILVEIHNIHDCQPNMQNQQDRYQEKTPPPLWLVDKEISLTIQLYSVTLTFFCDQQTCCPKNINVYYVFKIIKLILSENLTSTRFSEVLNLWSLKMWHT